MAETLNKMAKSLIRRARARPFDRRSSAETVRELLTHVEHIGADLEALVRRARVPHAAKSLMDPSWRGQLSRGEFARLYAECTWSLDAHASWQEGRAALTKPELDLLWYGVINCGTLREVIGRTTEYSALLVPRTARLSLKVEGEAAIFYMATVRRYRTVSAFVSDLTGLAMHNRLFGWLIGEAIAPLEAALRYPPLLSDAAVARLMPVPITYNAPENSFRFPARFLEKPVVRSYPELLRFLEHFPFDPEEEQSKDSPFSERVRLLLRSALIEGSPLPTSTEMARQLRISPATLRRRLADERLSLMRIKDMTRREIAERLLAEDQLTVADVAARAGFSDSTTFSRAFKAWTGRPPTRWIPPSNRTERDDAR